jgi:putative membrane protein
MYDTDHMTAGGWILGSVMVVLLIVLVAIAIAWLLRSTAASGAATRSEGGRGSAREVLDRRLALGEIGEEEYRTLRAVLSGAASDGSATTSESKRGANRAPSGVS